MTGSSKNSTENYPRKCFQTQQKETRVKFNPGLTANRLLNDWAQLFKPRVSAKFECRFESLKSKFILILLVYNMMIG